MMCKCLIVARAKDGAIGKDGALLWHLSEDLKMFKAVTMGCPVIMGRKTFLSIGKPLPGRLNIVLTRSWKDAPEGITLASSLADAYDKCGDAEKCFVIGGGSVYAQALPEADMAYVTEIDAPCPDADTFFPELDPSDWEIQSRSGLKTDERSGLSYEFVVYSRRK